MSTKKPETHILALSGGKDSAALAVYMREKYPHIPLEYVFIDSGCELPETEQYIQRIRAILNIQITRIGGVSKQDGRDFKWWLKQKSNYLPSAQNRWCTEVLKLNPYSKWLHKKYGDFVVYSYVGLRADEKRNRTGYLDKSGLLIPRNPFVEDGLVYADIKYLLESSGIGFPSYYEWRSRSG
ncbi:MAG: phosphoadenosine phosphosulfate reductase, partial [Dehalococcoidia bacterium]